MALRTFILQLFLSLVAVRAVTVYNQQPLSQITSLTVTPTATATNAAASASATTYKAYDNTTLTPPALPSPLPATQFAVQLQSAASNVPGLSIMQSGSFLGFSIETSVITQVCECLSSCACLFRWSPVTYAEPPPFSLVRRWRAVDTPFRNRCFAALLRRVLSLSMTCCISPSHRASRSCSFDHVSNIDSEISRCCAAAVNDH